MRSASWAVAWEFWGHNRITMVLTLGYLAIVAMIVNLAPAGTFHPKAVIEMTIPLWGALALMIAVFSHGGEDVMSRASGYPRRAFTLPLRTTALVTGPMVLGSVAVALLWLVLAGLVLRPGGVPVPLAWPAVFGMALVAWVQALMWCPFPLFALRAIVGILVIGSLAAGAAAGAYHDVSPILLLAVSAGLVPLGYGVAVTGLARARRGDGAVWHWPAWRRRHAVRGAFASAAAAQFWLEWRRHWWPMPLMIGGLVAAELLLFVSVRDIRFSAIQAGAFLVSLILFPPVIAAAAGVSLGNADARTRESYAMGPFSATRPLASADLLAVKLRVAVWIVLLTAALSVVLIAAMVPLTQVGLVLWGWTRALTDTEGIHGAALAVAGVLALALLIAKAMVDHLCIGLAGRAWLVVTVGGVVPVVLVAGSAFGGWVASHPDDLLAFVPWAIGGALVLKLALGALVVRAIRRRRLVAPRTLVRFAAVWIGGAAFLVGAALWLTPPDVYPPALVACAVVVLGLPTVRLGLAPLALDWNRHR